MNNLQNIEAKEQVHEEIFQSFGCTVEHASYCIDLSFKISNEGYYEFEIIAKFPAVMNPDSSKVTISEIDLHVDKVVIKGVYTA